MACTDKCSVLRRRVELEAWQDFCLKREEAERERVIARSPNDPPTRTIKRIRKHWGHHLTAANQEHIDHAFANDYDYRDSVTTEYDLIARVRADVDGAVTTEPVFD